MVHEVEDFYGVYLLLSCNPYYKGRTYIGYTVDPNRRIKQHNTGSKAGGAWRTSGRGPWEMVLIIHGFPNNICALRFEWAWQHPDLSLNLKHVPVTKRKSETTFQHRWRIVCHMLTVPPWNRLALNIRWLKQDFKLEFPSNLAPPAHMPVVFGPVRSKKISGSREIPTKTCSSSSPIKRSSQSAKAFQNCERDCIIPPLVKKKPLCGVCHHKIKMNDHQLTCFWPDCNMISHMTCLAQCFLGDDSEQLIPVEGPCPGCRRSLLWGDLIRHFKGCYQNLSSSSAQTQEEDSQESMAGSDWTDDLNS